MNIRKELKNLLSFQAKAIRDTIVHIGPHFEEAVKALYKCQGKVVVTGVGKSGLVAQKVAATFSSTGTPSIYLNPFEGIHGNLGMIDKRDIVFIIGKSGESEEILNILPVLKKIGSKIISLTANEHSTTAKRSDIVLHMPIKREACPHNLAPTTSTTVALTIGDAIAIVLMKMRNFGPDSFALFHPGGVE